MCGHCGCQGVDAIGELRDEHAALQEEAHRVRQDLARGDESAAAASLGTLLGHLERHVTREERGIFTALRDQGDFADEVAQLETEHADFHAATGALRPGMPGFGDRTRRLLDGLDLHIEREDLGIFPVSVVTLGAAGWEAVDQAHAEIPTFLQGAHP